MTVGLRDFVPELARQPLLFRETFRTRADTLKNGATLVGSGTSWPAGGGVTFDGNGNLRYTISGSQLFSSTVTFEARFTFGFAPDDGVQHYLIDCTGGAASYRLVLAKLNTNALFFQIGAAALFSFAYATWSGAVVAGENVLIISTTSGATSVWLNGTLIGTSAAAWSATNISGITSMRVGASGGDLLRWVGTIYSIEIYGSVSTAVDEPLLRQGNLVESVSFDNALSYLRGRNYYRRAGDGLYVTDVGGKGTVTQALMGSDGSTVAQFPGIIRPNGFSFDGGDQINLGDADQFSFTNGVNDLPFSLSCIANFSSLVAARTLIDKADSSTVGEWLFYVTATGQIVFVLVDNTNATFAQRTTPVGTVRAGINYVLIGTYAGAGGAAGVRIYVNGIRLDTATGGAGYVMMRNTVQPVRCGYGGGAGTRWMIGNNILPAIWNTALSPLEAEALTARYQWEARRA